MDKKIIRLDAFEIYGKDALEKDDDELFQDSLREFISNDMDSAKALLDMLKNLKEESLKIDVPYEKLIEDELQKLIEGITVDERNRNKFIYILSKNNISN